MTAIAVRARSSLWRVPLAAGAIVIAALLLAAPALWNGFPLLYWDSYDYMGIPFGAKMPMFRAASYTVITVFGALAGSLWVPIALQCLLAAWYLHEFAAVFLPWPAWRTLPVLTVLIALLTAQPWFTSQLMADGFTAPMLLGVAALTFGLGRLKPWRAGALIVALVPAVAVHTSHVGLLAGLILVFAAVRLAGRFGYLRWLAPAVLPVCLVLTGGVGLAATANWAVTGRVFVSQTANILLLARMVQDGIAKRYLADACGRGEPFRLCPYLADLPNNANQFLWTPGPFYKAGGWTPEMDEEARAIIRGSLAAYPLVHVESALRLTIEQLFQVRTGDGVVKLDTIHADGDVKKDPFMPKIIGKYYPRDFAAYWPSRQRQNIDFTAINSVQVTLAYAGYAGGLAALVLAWRRRDRLGAGLAGMAVLAILGNAFICGALSNPNHRYQARIAWTAVAAVAVVLIRARERDDVRCVGENMPL
jgi:hypothetical protein